MTVTLDLPPELEAGLLAQAQTHGLGLEAYLVDHVLREAAKTQIPPEGRKKSLVELFSPASRHRDRFLPQPFHRAPG